MENLYHLERVNRVIDYLKNNPNKEITLKKVAAIAMFSEFHFHRIFKKATGLTLHQYIKQLRMEKAGASLENGDKISLKELWSQLGYYTASNFSRDFRHYYGCTPSQYVQRLQENKTKKKRRKESQNEVSQAVIINSTGHER